MRNLFILILLIGISSLQAQHNVIDLGTDTINFDVDFEYLAAFETQKKMESYLFYRSAVESYHSDDLYAAKDYINKAIKLNKNELKFQLLKAWILSKNESYKKAIKQSEKIIAVNSKHKEARYCKALNHYLLGENQSARIAFTKLIELDADNHQAFFGRAEAHYELGQIENAIADYTATLAIKPNMVLAYESRAKAYMRLYNYKQALVDLNQAISAQPQQAELYHLRGICYLRENNNPSACKNFEQAIDLGFRASAEFFNKHCKF